MQRIQPQVPFLFLKELLLWQSDNSWDAFLTLQSIAEERCVRLTPFLDHGSLNLRWNLQPCVSFLCAAVVERSPSPKGQPVGRSGATAAGLVSVESDSRRILQLASFCPETNVLAFHCSTGSTGQGSYTALNHWRVPSGKSPRISLSTRAFR